jgi:TonB family protein
MKVTEQGAPRLGLGRRNPSTVRIGPRFVCGLFAHFGIDNTSLEITKSASGLLFGTAEQGLVTLEAFKMCPVADPEKGSPKAECLSAAFEPLLGAAKIDPDLTSLELVGWYRIGESGDTVSLLDGDIEFHNRRFRRATDIALILNPKMPTGVLLQVYSRSSNAALSRQDHRLGSLLIDSAVAVKAPIDLALRQTINDDHDVKLLQVLDSSGRGKRREGWKRITLWYKRTTLSSLRAKSMRVRNSRAVPNLAPDSSGPPAKTPAAPQLNAPPRRVQSAQAKLRWASSALLLVLGTGAALAWVYSGPLLSALPGRASLFGTVAPAGLEMRVDPHIGGSLLLRWNAHSASLESAKNGILQVDDGSEHRKLQLDSNELANGSILYTPTSGDVMFRLEVVDRNGSPMSESMRVVNAANSGWAAHRIPNAGASSLFNTAPRVAEKLQSVGTKSQGKVTPLAAIQKNPAPDIKVRPDHGTPAPALNARITPASTLRAAPPRSPGGSGTQGPGVMRSSSQKALAPERKLQAIRSPAEAGSAKLSGGNQNSTKTVSSSATPALRKAVQDVSSERPPVNSPEPAVTKNSAANSPSTTYVPARPLKQVMPRASDFGSSALPTAIDVDVEVRIDDQGRVIEAQVVNNRSKENGLLASAALAAAKEWIFEPAKVNGKNVPSEHAIAFHFRPQLRAP